MSPRLSTAACMPALLSGLLVLILPQPPARAQATPDEGQARLFHQMGLEPAEFNAEALGLSLHLPEKANVQVTRVGDRPAYIVADAPQPTYWRMQIELVTLAPPPVDEPLTIPDTDGFLDRILSRQSDYQVLLRESHSYGGMDGRLCYIQRTGAQGDSVINGWLVLPSGRSSLIVISISALPSVFPDLKPLFDKSFGTIRVKTQEERSIEDRARVEAARNILASITPERLRALVGAQQWFRTYRPAAQDGSTAEQEIACSVVEVVQAPRGALKPNRDVGKYTPLEKEQGIMVKVQGRVVVDAPRGVYFDSVAMYWMAWDQSSEAWSVLGTHRQGEASRTEGETGLRTAPSVGNPIPHLTVVRADPAPYEWDVPEVYLSQTLAWLLGRLLPRDVTEPTFYTWYFYNARGMRPALTLRYDRWEPLSDGSGHWQLSTLLSKDQPPDVSIYAADGTLIRRARPTGEITEPASREQILRLWKAKGLRTGPSSP